MRPLLYGFGLDDAAAAAWWVLSGLALVYLRSGDRIGARTAAAAALFTWAAGLAGLGVGADRIRDAPLAQGLYAAGWLFALGAALVWWSGAKERAARSVARTAARRIDHEWKILCDDEKERP